MSRIIRIALLLLIIIGAASGVYLKHSREIKLDMRDEALLYFREEDYEKAIDCFEKAGARKTLFSDEIDTDINCYLAESYRQLGEYEEALDLYDMMLRWSPSNKRFYILKGDCLEKNGQDEEAVECYEEGYQKTGDADFLLKLCKASMSKKDYKSAHKYANKGLKKEKESKASFLFEKIVIYEKEQKYKKAWQTAKKYVKLYPDDKKGRKEYIFLSTRI